MNEENQMKLRLQLLCAALKVSQRDFASKIEMSPSYIASLAKDISLNVVTKILTAYPNVSVYYLLFGNGEPLLPDGEQNDLIGYLKQENRALREKNINLIKKNFGLEKEIEMANAELEKQRKVMTQYLDNNKIG